jgi:hypothetical protein
MRNKHSATVAGQKMAKLNSGLSALALLQRSKRDWRTGRRKPFLAVKIKAAKTISSEIQERITVQACKNRWVRGQRNSMKAAGPRIHRWQDRHGKTKIKPETERTEQPTGKRMRPK